MDTQCQEIGGAIMSEVQACLLTLLFNGIMLLMNVCLLGICVKLVTEQMKETRHHRREMAEK